MNWLEFFTETVVGYEKLIILCAIGLAIEYFWPNEKNQPAKSILFNIIWVLNFLVVTNILMLLLGRSVGIVVETFGGPWFDLNLPDTGWAWLVHFFIFILLYDFGYYWMHRAQHKWDWFWCHHKLHHNDEHVNATTSFRHHWMENVYRLPFIVIPMSLLVEVDSTMPVILFDILLIWAVFTHLNVRLYLGPLTRVIAGPQYHRIHHSNVRVHQDKNMAAYFPIWDILFGTAYIPEKDEYPTCGTMDGETVWSVWEANVGVFKGWWALAHPAPKQAAAEPQLESPEDPPQTD
jgi:sterol desaturase/sphingolipid hydroxylase (fatty acid hydroxylase superfamily)